MRKERSNISLNVFKFTNIRKLLVRSINKNAGIAYLLSLCHNYNGLSGLESQFQ